MKYLLILLLLIPSIADAATYYVRNDGSTATNCTGLADAPYDGSGTGEACAWRSLATALPRTGALISGGDTVIIDHIDETVGSGQAKYEIGYAGADMVIDGTCYAAASYACTLAAIPAGSDSSHKTKIYGKNWQSCDNLLPNQKAQLFSSGKSSQLLTWNSNVDIRCLDLTTHQNCLRAGAVSATQCQTDCSLGTCYGSLNGLSGNGSGNTNVYVENVDVHGFYHGIFSIGNGNITLSKTRLIANEFTGWEQDDGGGGASNTGTITLDRSKIMYTGCGEVYPLANNDITTTANLYDCHNDTQNGYGDAIGIPNVDPGAWTITDSEISYNGSDGLDLLHSTSASTVLVKRSKFVGNVGNTIKTGAGNAVIEDSLSFANCGWFKGQTFTAYDPAQSGRSGTGCNSNGTCEATENSTNCSADCPAFNICRASGNNFAIGLTSGKTFKLFNNTIAGNADIFIDIYGSGCDSTSQIISANNIYVGGKQYYQQADYPATYYSGGGSCSGYTTSFSYDQFYLNQALAAPSGTGNTYAAPPLNGGSISDNYTGQSFDFTLSSALAGDATTGASLGADSTDLNNYDRGASWDRGAYEYGTTAKGRPVQMGPGCTMTGNAKLN